MIKCVYKDCSVNEKNETKESKLHLHHLVPKFMGGTDGDGRRWLCKEHHDELHLKIPYHVLKFIPEDKKEECREIARRISLRFIGEK